MSMSMSDVGWYQCYTDLDGETYSSIGYFLYVKPSEEFHDDVDSNADSIGYIEDDEMYEGGEKSDSGNKNKINDGISSDQPRPHQPIEIIFKWSGIMWFTRKVVSAKYREVLLKVISMK